jgi:predicted nucleic acid-binding protein
MKGRVDSRPVSSVLESCPSVGEHWLIPATAEAAEALALGAVDLRGRGWHLLASAEPGVVMDLDHKVRFAERAVRLGLDDLLPRHFTCVESAEYPCVAKPATGDFGRGVVVCKKASQVPARFSRQTWVLQEAVRGKEEVSMSMIVLGGVVQSAIRATYTYETDLYVHPRVREEKEKRRHEWLTADDRDVEVQTLEPFLQGFSGVCNVNYKRRTAVPSRELAIFEVNARLGGDLGCDAPPRLLGRALWRLREVALEVERRCEMSGLHAGSFVRVNSAKGNV